MAANQGLVSSLSSTDPRSSVGYAAEPRSDPATRPPMDAVPCLAMVERSWVPKQETPPPAVDPVTDGGLRHNPRASAQVSSRLHQSHRGLANIALLACREKVVLPESSSNSEGNDVVDVENDARRAAGATAVATAKAIAQ
jgi:hypothetical protein